MANTVFFSFTFSDQPLQEWLLQQLEQSDLLGLGTSLNRIDSRLSISDNADHLRSIIQDRIQSSSHVVVLWTENASISPSVMYEMGMADALDKPIIVIQADESAPALPANIVPKTVIRLAIPVPASTH